jgi:hypothetical protein
MRALFTAALLATATLALAVFVLVNLYAADAPTPPPPPPAPSRPAAIAADPPPTSPIPRPAPPTDNREHWREVYAARQRDILAEIERNQELIERGDEHDERRLAEARARIETLRDQLRREIEELQRVAPPPQ